MHRIPNRSALLALALATGAFIPGAAAQIDTPCATLRASDEFANRNVVVTDHSGGSHSGASAMELDTERGELSFLDRAGREIKLPLTELEEIAVERGLLEMNPIQQTTPWRIVETETEPFERTVPIDSLAIGNSAVAFGSISECAVDGPRLLEIEAIEHDKASGTFRVIGSVVTYEKSFFGGPTGSTLGTGKN